MAYKAKNLSGSRRKLLSAKSETQTDLHKAISEVNAASREQAKLDKMVKDNKQFNQQARFLGYAAKRSGDRRAFAQKEYDTFKSNYDKLIGLDEYKDSKDNFFPEFDDFYKNRAKARVGGVDMSKSDMSMGTFDIDSLNLKMKLYEMNQGK